MKQRIGGALVICLRRSELTDKAREYRIRRPLQETLHMNQKQFADYLHVNPNQIRDWEQERKTISRRSWEKYFRKE